MLRTNIPQGVDKLSTASTSNIPQQNIHKNKKEKSIEQYLRGKVVNQLLINIMTRKMQRIDIFHTRVAFD